MLCNVIERYFDPDYERTIKSSDRLGKNLIGYRSSNYVVKLGGEYFGKWYEYQAFKEMYFEIQVATLLDFTWMEIEHDRVYKTAHNFHQVLVSNDDLIYCLAYWNSLIKNLMYYQEM